jgi:hypothetical protein
MAPGWAPPPPPPPRAAASCSSPHTPLCAPHQLLRFAFTDEKWHCTDFRLQFANGQLVGGLDIMKELKESGDLADSLK